MPWDVIKDEKGWWVVKKGTRKKVHEKPHKSKEEARNHQKALYAAEDMGKADASRLKRGK